MPSIQLHLTAICATLESPADTAQVRCPSVISLFSALYVASLSITIFSFSPLHEVLASGHL